MTTTGTESSTEATQTIETTETTTQTSETTATTMMTTTGPCPTICEPGTIEYMGNCGDKCGREIRACTDDGCAWSEWFCTGEDDCGMWILPDGESVWTPVRPDELGPERPTAKIEGAFDVALTREIVVLTNESFHVIDLDSGIYTTTGMRIDLFPELDSLEIRSIYSRNPAFVEGGTPSSEEKVAILTDDTIFSYNVDADGLVATLTGAGPCCDGFEGWAGSNAPQPSLLIDAWHDPQNVSAWHDVDLSGCLENPEMLQEHYVYLVADNTLRLFEPVFCTAFVDTLDIGAHQAFAYPGAPPQAVIGGLSHLSGLYVLPRDPT